MLTLTVKGRELWDKKERVFVPEPDSVLHLEHSLVSLSKWERKVQKPFLQSDKSREEMLFYLECMCLDPEFPPEVWPKLTQKDVDIVAAYIDDKMSATWFMEDPVIHPRSQVITSELIYSWMTAYQIPFETQNWHLNNLITLIRVIDQQRSTKKESRSQTAARQRALNEARLKKYGTDG